MGEATGHPTGKRGEDAALATYLRRGYRLVARNWRCSMGELDLVLSRGQLVVFCEVKARTATGLGGPHDAVNWKKQRKVRLLAQAFLAGSTLRADEVRFDVASVLVGAGGSTSVEVFEQAF